MGDSLLSQFHRVWILAERSFIIKESVNFDELLML
jgi:hypothetical protein